MTYSPDWHDAIGGVDTEADRLEMVRRCESEAVGGTLSGYQSRFLSAAITTEGDVISRDGRVAALLFVARLEHPVRSLEPAYLPHRHRGPWSVCARKSIAKIAAAISP